MNRPTPGEARTLARQAGERTHHFHGGLHLRHHKQVSCTTPVVRPPLPERLVVPLFQQSGRPDPARVVAEVSAGETVLKGQRLGRAASAFDAHVHAPTSGRVVAVDQRPFTHPSGLAGPCVVIEPDGAERWRERAPLAPWTEAAPESLAQRIRDAGVVGLGGAVFPTHRKLRPGIHTVILNGAECEPYISCDEMLMREHARLVIEGGRMLAATLGAERVVIGIEDQMGAVATTLAAALRDGEQHGDTDLDVVRVTTIYPEGGERQLVQVLTGLEVPDGGYPIDLGLVVVNVATAAAVAMAVLEDAPLIERYVTVTGPGIRSPRNLLALVGTPFSHLVEHCGGYSDDVDRLVIGGPLMGYAIPGDDLTVTKAANCLLALTPAMRAGGQPEMPCIWCGECARVCPAVLQPQELHWRIRAGQWDALDQPGLDACIECGCCDLVCPSHIPLTSWFRHGKDVVREHRADRQRADRARERFEARSARHERIERERLAAREQRKAALRDGKRRDGKVQAAIERARDRARARRDGDRDDE